MQNSKIVVIGGSAAGAKAAAKARRLDQQAEITIVQKDPDLSMASCGYPYYIGGTFDERNQLLATPTGVVRNPDFFYKTKRINALVNTECTAIDRNEKKVTCRNLESGEETTLSYHKLVVATGASAAVLPVPGRELEGVSTLVSMQDTDRIHDLCASGTVTEAVVIGGGLIGVETCEALVAKGVKVTLVEMEKQVLTFLDAQFAGLVANHMKAKSVSVRLGMRLERCLGEDGRLTGVELANGEVLPCQLAVVAAGVRPNIGLAEAAGLEIGESRAIAVNEYMQTSDADIYAAGDCVECVNSVTGKKVYAPMGDLANLQGRVLGENLIEGNVVKFGGTQQTAICKVFDFVAGATGLSEKAAIAAGLTDFETVVNASPDKPGFMGAKLLVSKILVEKSSQKILGYQCVGSGDVSRQIATAAMAIKGRLTLDDLNCADLPYAPPFSLAIDHFIASAHIISNKLKGRIKTVTAEEVYKRVQEGNPPFFIDGRGPDEHEVLRLGIGEKYIPLGMLRNVLGELPQEKDTEIVCFCKISLRGYETALILEANGYTNVKVMEGGIMAWPYSREK
ncbi:FAD-dependent oxidoreductase [Desulfosediminicola sp.]|uniref:FAD-dependent oxidoreductase n=1 Tax=Desulfosediminicola sp. TaxID=2886825 RepID=UPI003AF29449